MRSIKVKEGIASLGNNNTLFPSKVKWKTKKIGTEANTKCIF